MKKCPPGVICVENFTLFFIFVIFCIIILLASRFIIPSVKNYNNETITIENQQPLATSNFLNAVPSYPYTNLPNDVLLNPHAAPYSDERYFVPRPPNTIPINVSTNVGAVDTAYRQMGILTPLNEDTTGNILPLMGRPLYTNRNKWQYYSISNQHNNVKLPISFKGKGALNDYGVDQIFTGDTVYVEGYNNAFRATVYENDTIKYLPFL